MKKFLILLFIFMLLPFSVSASKVNYTQTENLSWLGGLACSFEATKDYVKFTNITTSYSSPYFDILPAFIKAIGNKNQVTLEITIKIKADFKAENTASKFHLNIRAFTDAKNAEIWRNHHKTEDCCRPTFFQSSGSNVSYTLPSSSKRLENNWNSYTFLVTASEEQINCPVTPNWYLCFDGLEPNLLKAIYVESVVISLYTQTPSPTQKVTAHTPRPMRTISPIVAIATPTPTVSPSPTPSPTPDWLNQPAVEDMSSISKDVARYTFNIIIAIGILYYCVTSAIKKNKK